jgi:regulatory protein
MSPSSREPISCYARAVNLLATRAHFRQELARKLGQRGYGEADVREALERLEGQGLLGDADTAQQFVEARRRRAPVGAARLRADLIRRGASSTAIVGALAETDPGEEARRAEETARRWLASHRAGGETGETSRAKLARHLAGKGFAAGIIARTLRFTRGSPEGEEGLG